jgi:hypothetical protein
MTLYREAYIQGAGRSDGRLDRDNLRHIGIFQEGYPFPGGPINVDAAFRELQRNNLISFPGRNRQGLGIDVLREQAVVPLLVREARQLARDWGVRQPSARFLPNVVHGERQANPYRDPLSEAARAERRAAPGQGRNLAKVVRIGKAKQLPHDLEAEIGSYLTGIEGPTEHQANVLKGRVGYQGPLRPVGRPVGRPVEVSSSEASNRTRRRRAKRSPRKSRKVRKH